MSKNFSLSEFKCPQSGKVQVSTELLKKLEALRSELGNVPVTITSGYRTPEYNKQIGGASDSQHVTGEGADIKVQGKTIQQIKQAALKVGFTGVGTYPAHVHVDVRNGPVVTWEGAY